MFNDIDLSRQVPDQSPIRMTWTQLGFGTSVQTSYDDNIPPGTSSEESIPTTSAASPSPIRHPQLWFPDGTIILATPEMLFKVYKGILSCNSTVFRDMFSLPTPGSAAPMDSLDGVHTVHMQDHHEDLAVFLLATHVMSSVASSLLKFVVF